MRMNTRYAQREIIMKSLRIYMIIETGIYLHIKKRNEGGEREENRRFNQRTLTKTDVWKLNINCSEH